MKEKLAHEKKNISSICSILVHKNFIKFYKHLCHLSVKPNHFENSLSFKHYREESYEIFLRKAASQCKTNLL